MSLVEAVTNVVVGYGLAVATQIIVFGIETGIEEHLTIGLAFVAVSPARGYLLRRLFESVRLQPGSSSQVKATPRASAADLSRERVCSDTGAMM